MFVEVILPLAISTHYTYEIPSSLKPGIQIGIRAEVPLKNKLYAGLIYKIHKELPQSPVKIRQIISVLDTEPIVEERQFRVWFWMAKYYCCTIGEVMNMVLPSGLKLNSETKLKATNRYEEISDQLTEKEFLIAEAASIQNEISLDTAKDILQQKTVLPHIRNLVDKGVLQVEEELIDKYKPKFEDYVQLHPKYKNEEDLDAAFKLIERSNKQKKALEVYLLLSYQSKWVPKKGIYELANSNQSVIAALVKKEIFIIENREVSRLVMYEGEVQKPPPLSTVQDKALREIRASSLDHILLFGVTGSGKTRVYIDLIQETLSQGKQVIYLVPEIALTTQLVQRLQKVFGDEISLYHSKLNNHSRVELYHEVRNGKPIIMGARSSLFLPFKDLGLIIVDEEHDPSYKQNDPAPRYNARDTALYISKIYGAKVILGSATPSMESFLNAKIGKYALVKMLERHGKATLPQIDVVDLGVSYKAGEVRSHFSKELVDGIVTALSKKEQVLLFQNRRGYAHTIKCSVCDWISECPNCDVTLTVHQYFQELRCHYCSHRARLPAVCPSCGNHKMSKMGFGTEKIESELQKIIPSARIARLDFDTAKTRAAYERILTDFDMRKIDVLVGTQMITKGLDFDNISLVGIMLADKSLFFPDFRANERSFQIFTQVAGRAGRREKQGRVILQTFSPGHDVIHETINYNTKRYYDRELQERQDFRYPPFFRLIHVLLKHKDPNVVRDQAKLLGDLFKEQLGNRVLGPTPPGIARIRGLFQEQIIIKMEKQVSAVNQIKKIVEASIKTVKKEGNRSVRIIVDVDP